MGYYDSVKDNVKDNNGDDKNPSKDRFDTLKQSAEQNTKPDEEKGDDTPIEVVEEGGLRQKRSEKQEEERKPDETSEKEIDNPFTSGKDSGSDSVDVSGIEERLDKIIDQNERVIEILESFAS